jgi:hypothetical protein
VSEAIDFAPFGPADYDDGPAERHLPRIRPRIVLTSEADLENVQPPTWLVDGVLPERGLALMFGASESFKSFLALDMALHVAAARHWHGRPVTGGPVVYVAAEGFFGLKKRYRAAVDFHAMSTPAGIHFLSHGIEVSRGSRDLVDLSAAIREQVGDRVALVVIDTLNRNMVGNENAADDMGSYLKGCEQLRDAHGAAVYSIHHTGHLEADRSRGHSSLRAALDAEMKCVRDGDRVTLECTKMKDAPHFPPLNFDMVPSGPSLVPKAVGTSDVKLTDARAKALEILPTEDGLTHKAWLDASTLPARTFANVLTWAKGMAYVRQVRGGKYVRTDAATLALVPRCQPSADLVPSSEGLSAMQRGGV